ncbi:MAG TPA: universal stress protein [Beutenbergiaceae bacterium]|nr:universal stress protein [Beutenbergiaceae bacterium]
MVKVGYDGSSESQVAVQWAAAVARRREVSLEVISATGVDVEPGVYRAGLAVGTRQRAQSIAEEGAALAREVADIAITPTGVEAGAVSSLVEASENAELIVIGNRGLGRLRGVLLGSTAFSVVMHAVCNVAVVRGALRPLPSPERPIVVGVDGSPGSVIAVREAARLAGETGALLKLVSAYEQLTLSGVERESEAIDRVERAISQAQVGVEHEIIVAPGRPERVIVEAAEGASLIVLGARGRGDFARLLLGSVARDVIHYADRTVYIAR